MNKKQRMIAIVGSLSVLLGGYYTYKHMFYVETDNAQISAHFLMLSSRVNGTIQKVLVNENQKVKKGDILAQIDTSDFSTASQAAESQVAALQARYQEAETNYRRASELLKSQAISQEKYDAALASSRDLGARLKQAQAQLEQAKLNVSYTTLVAPDDGVVARKAVEPGQFVPAGQALFGFVSSAERWVTANLKETELTGVEPGRPVTIEVDALPGRTFKGEIESVGPSTGALFSLLPPDNASGNFTKVVQRVPVRVKLLELTAAQIDELPAGLSAIIQIRVR